MSEKGKAEVCDHWVGIINDTDQPVIVTSSKGDRKRHYRLLSELAGDEWFNFCPKCGVALNKGEVK